jgi:hypothetical protein
MCTTKILIEVWGRMLTAMEHRSFVLQKPEVIEGDRQKAPVKAGKEAGGASPPHGKG